MTTGRYSCALLLAVATPCWSKVAYAPVAVSHVRHGAGGQHFARNGIDWWTSGEPARDFVVVGLVTDDRERLALSGEAIGSRSVAATVKANHGDAVLMGSVRDVPVCPLGQEYLCRRGHVLGHSEGVDLRITHLVAIRYV